ncbi:hypothetical protein K490DRAFT_55510 [Saccharata proteae CBS 121410]|uniref:Magnesium transporter n=1 Tax=Saccharata proteae CBS 121410 TaxID=1314787 RepID=A0A6A5YBK6_9PEZI|nr:hypothetical protein K490DRAFT_55510 [Saccharata proteae CBS 121410]
MAFLSGMLTLVGALFLIHAVYSAHEHSALYASITSSPATATVANGTIPSLPSDIVFETLASVILVSLGIVLSSPALKPIQWSKWAGEAEREEVRRRKGTGKSVPAGEAPGGNPFAWLTEERMGFWDGRGKKQDFDDWVRQGGKS